MYKKEELKELKKEFWESFSIYCFHQPYLRGRKPMWMLYDTKVKGVELKFELERKGMIVALEVNHRSESARLEMFERLSWYRETLEKGFDEGALTWDICYVRHHGEQVCRIYCEMQGADFHRRTDWGELFAFMAKNMYLLESNFAEFAEELRD